MKNINIIPDLLEALSKASEEKIVQATKQRDEFSYRFRDNLIVKSAKLSSGTEYIDKFIPFVLRGYDPEFITMQKELDSLNDELYCLLTFRCYDYYKVDNRIKINLDIDTIRHIELISAFFNEEERKDIYELLTDKEKRSLIKYNKQRLFRLNLSITRLKELSEKYFVNEYIELQLINSENDIITSQSNVEEFIILLESQIDKYLVEGINDYPINDYNKIKSLFDLKQKLSFSEYSYEDVNYYVNYYSKKSAYIEFMNLVKDSNNFLKNLSEESSSYLNLMIKLKIFDMQTQLNELFSNLNMDLLNEKIQNPEHEPRIKK